MSICCWHPKRLVLGMLLLLSHVQLFCDPKDYSLPGSSVHGISQARILEWVAISFSRESSPPRNQTHIPALAGRFFTTVSSGKPCIGSTNLVKEGWPWSFLGSDQASHHVSGAIIFQDNGLFRIKLLTTDYGYLESRDSKKDSGKSWRYYEFLSFFFFLFIFLIFLSMQHNIWDLSSLNRDQICAPCIGSAEC